jgi:galactofuranose transport system ATP-binding protein
VSERPAPEPPVPEPVPEHGHLLEVRGLTVEFPAVRALDEVDFDVRPGEIHAVMGENGAGKSTLINVLSGLIRPRAGQITFRGSPFIPASPAQAEAAGISTVHQELDLIPTLSVAENISLGRFPRRAGLISWKLARKHAAAALSRLGVSLNPRRTLGACSIAEQQLVAIARALDTDCRLLILDEPTSSLDAAEVRELLALVSRLRDQGLGIILITHFLDQAYAISDRMTVLRNGRPVGTWATRDLPRSALVESMTGRAIERAPDRTPSRATGGRGSSADTRANAREAPPLLELHNLGRTHAIAPVSTPIDRGETIGLAGLLGSGRTELARLIFGADQPTSGHVLLDGNKIGTGSVPDSIRRGLAMTPEDRKSQGLFLDLSIRDNIILAMQARRGPLRPIPIREQRRLAEHYIAALSIKTPRPEVPVRTLSGGNQQKVLLARWLAMQPKVLILDEPTRGIDVGARAEIESLIRSLRALGMAIILISAEVDELVRVCTRALVLRDRRCIGDLAGEGLTEPAILSRIADPAKTTS